MAKDTWKIWFEWFNEKDEKCGAGVLLNEYKHKGNAIRRAKQQFSNLDIDSHHVKWVVSQENPFAT